MHEATHERISLAQAARWLSERRPHAVSPLSVWRACRIGRRSRSGEVVRLQHWRVGRRLTTSIAAILRFEQELAESDLRHFSRGEVGPPPKSRTRHQGAQAMSRANADLRRQGFDD